jgi:hypothetical protein
LFFATTGDSASSRVLGPVAADPAVAGAVLVGDTTGVDARELKLDAEPVGWTRSMVGGSVMGDTVGARGSRNASWLRFLFVVGLAGTGGDEGKQSTSWAVNSGRMAGRAWEDLA